MNEKKRVIDDDDAGKGIGRKNWCAVHHWFLAQYPRNIFNVEI